MQSKDHAGIWQENITCKTEAPGETNPFDTLLLKSHCLNHHLCVALLNSPCKLKHNKEVEYEKMQTHKWTQRLQTLLEALRVWRHCMSWEAFIWKTGDSLCKRNDHNYYVKTQRAFVWQEVTPEQITLKSTVRQSLTSSKGFQETACLCTGKAKM